jgi:4-diphosphocytidyl-2C-methyl-D-erythritol kinase
MTNGEQVTGARDEHYNLVSVLYHTLQQADTIERYISDARQVGDDELAGFFQEVQEQDGQRAERAKKLLTERVA